MKTTLASRIRTPLCLTICAAILLLYSQFGQAATSSAVAAATVAEPNTGQEYVVLCYHSIPARFNGDDGANSVANFTAHLAWLRENGYTALRMDDVLAAKAGLKALPKKAYLLTVDDGYADFYVNVFPILKTYKIPAVFAVVGRWIENGVDQDEGRADPFYAKQQFVTWAQVKEMSDSGLVEIASHTFDLHRGVLANPQGNQQPAATTGRYNPETKAYESIEDRRLRVRSDLNLNSQLIRQQTGKLPRIMVWPYGEMDKLSSEEAARAGMPINMTLVDGFASVNNTGVIPRSLIKRELKLSDFSYLVRHKETFREREPVRAIRLSMDRIYDSDPEQQDQKLGRLLEQVARLGVNTILLQPFATPAEGGKIEQTYFPNSLMPMRADLLDRTAWQMHSRLNVDVFLQIDPARLERDGRTREEILQLYGEMSLHVPVQGVLFEGSSADFDLLGSMNYWPLPKIYIAARQPSVATILDVAYNGAAAAYASDQLIEGFVIARPVDAAPAKLDAFVRGLPANRINVLSLSLKDANSEDFRKMPAQIRSFQYHGITDFLVNGDDFLDDPAKTDLVRQAVSLKSNPFAVFGE
jgi:peptidoglycan/xylan/chitin deacetylase (PgdA/CDA1 family)